MSSAERTRGWRRRKDAEKRSKRVVFTKKYLDQIVRDGRITAEGVEDPEELGEMIEEDHYCQEHGTFRRGSIVTSTVTG